MAFREVVFPTSPQQGKNFQCMACRVMILIPKEELESYNNSYTNDYISKKLQEHVCIDYGYDNRDRFYDDFLSPKSKR